MGIGNEKEILKNRLESLIEQKKDLDYKLSETKQAELMDIPYQTFHKYVKGTAECSISNLAKIANYYNVSTDYLLGRTEVQTIDDFERAVCDYIGLSEEALNCLVAINLTSKMMNDDLGASTGISRIFEYLLEQDYISSLLIDLLMLAMGSQMVFTDNKDEKIPNSERNWKEITHDQECDLMRYRMSERFTNLLDEFDRRSINNKEYRKIKYGIPDYTDE